MRRPRRPPRGQPGGVYLARSRVCRNACSDVSDAVVRVGVWRDATAMTISRPAAALTALVATAGIALAHHDASAAANETHVRSHATWLVTPADPGAGGAATLMANRYGDLTPCLPAH